MVLSLSVIGTQVQASDQFNACTHHDGNQPVSAGGNRLDDLLGFRKLACRFLGVDERVAERDLIHTTVAGDEGHVLDLVIMIVEQCFRQTGGFLEVASGGAVFDRERSLVCHQSSPIHPTRPYCRR